MLWTVVNKFGLIFVYYNPLLASFVFSYTDKADYSKNNNNASCICSHHSAVLDHPRPQVVRRSQ